MGASGPATGSAGSGPVLVAHPSAELYGSDRMLVESVRSLVTAGHPVTVALPDEGVLAPVLREAGADVVVVPTVVLRRAFLSVRGLAELAVAAVATMPRMVRTVRAVGAEVVYVNTVTIPAWSLAARVAGVPVVCHVHEAEEDLPGPLAVALHSPLLLARSVLVNSRAARSALVGVLPRLASRVRLLYNGVAEPPAPPSAPRERVDGSLRLVLVGRLSPRKGTDVAVSAVAELVGRGVDVRLDLVGEVFAGYEWYEEELRTQVQALGLEDRVRAHGFRADVWPWLDAADVVLVPSRLEPFGNVAVEAALARRPVVASAVQGLQEIVSDGRTGRLVPAGDAVSLADAVQGLLRDWAGARRTADEAREEALRRFGARRYAEELVQVLEAARSSAGGAAGPA